MKISLKACEPHRYGLNCQQKFEIGHKLNYWYQPTQKMIAKQGKSSFILDY